MSNGFGYRSLALDELSRHWRSCILDDSSKDGQSPQSTSVPHRMNSRASEKVRLARTLLRKETVPPVMIAAKSSA